MASVSGSPLSVARADVTKIFVIVAGHESALLESDPTQLSRTVLLRAIAWEFKAQLNCAGARSRSLYSDLDLAGAI